MMNVGNTLGRFIFRGLSIAVMVGALAACGGDEDFSPPEDPPPPSGNPPPSNSPSIAGSPPNAISVGTTYDFRPSASDPNGDTLTFSIENRPSWASFDASTGRLSGTPSGAHVGTYADIRISVSDGSSTTSLPVFTITVSHFAQGSAVLSWVAPTQNTDGTALTDLAGYKIFYGTNAQALSQSIRIDNPGLTTYQVDNLSPATWYFTVRALTAKGVESSASNMASKTIS